MKIGVLIPIASRQLAAIDIGRRYSHTYIRMHGYGCRVVAVAYLGVCFGREPHQRVPVECEEEVRAPGGQRYYVVDEENDGYLEASIR